jgi:hypothetical protein
MTINYKWKRAHFDRQLETQYEQLTEISRRHLAVQDLPTGNPDPIPKQKYIAQKKTHRRTDARGLTGPELADCALIAKERAEQAAQAEERTTKRENARAPTPDNSDRPVLISATRIQTRRVIESQSR